MNTVGIFRNQLFKGSEVFIQQQAEALENFKSAISADESLAKIQRGLSHTF